MNLISAKAKSVLNDVTLTLIALFPILNPYHFRYNFTIGNILLLSVIVIRIVILERFNFHNLLFILGLGLAIYNFAIGFRYSDLQNSINNSVGGILISFTLWSFIVGYKYDMKKYFDTIVVISVVSVVFLMIQFYEYYFNSIVISGKLPLLGAVADVPENAFKSTEYGRCSSFFVEPAHYAIYLAPAFLYSLESRKFLLATLFIVGIILSTSLTGVILLISIILFYYLHDNDESRLLRLFKVILILIFGFLAITRVVNYYPDFIIKIASDSGIFSIRGFGSFQYLSEFSLGELITGIGLNRLEEWGLLHGYYIKNYANAWSYIVISFGLIGFTFAIIIAKLLYRNISQKSAGFYWILIIVMASDQILFNHTFWYLLFPILADFHSNHLRIPCGIRNMSR